VAFFLSMAASQYKIIKIKFAISMALPAAYEGAGVPSPLASARPTFTAQ
jgi:hypothetical protein